MPSSVFDAEQKPGRGTEGSRGQKRSLSDSGHLAGGECDKHVIGGQSHSGAPMVSKTGSLN